MGARCTTRRGGRRGRRRPPGPFGRPTMIATFPIYGTADGRLEYIISHGLLRIFLNVTASSVNPPNPPSRRSTSASVSRINIGQEEPPTRSGTYHGARPTGDEK